MTVYIDDLNEYRMIMEGLLRSATEHRAQATTAMYEKCLGTCAYHRRRANDYYALISTLEAPT